jgi:hypothetical protein
MVFRFLLHRFFILLMDSSPSPGWQESCPIIAQLLEIHEKKFRYPFPKRISIGFDAIIFYESSAFLQDETVVLRQRGAPHPLAQGLAS